eukprot:TRINITY_DN4552_c0_g1_i3.p1 TRINITY_DN4552_c0_g1~~TRINITY_DN4552_c0_g1_i3.p1  ORF type:complete len:170 (-),score=27.37 TRINITY_DN4552_c0_g1_i3:92-601(-)
MTSGDQGQNKVLSEIERLNELLARDNSRQIQFNLEKRAERTEHSWRSDTNFACKLVLSHNADYVHAAVKKLEDISADLESQEGQQKLKDQVHYYLSVGHLKEGNYDAALTMANLLDDSPEAQALQLKIKDASAHYDKTLHRNLWSALGFLSVLVVLSFFYWTRPDKTKR